MYKTINLFFSNISCLIYHLFLINCLKKCLSKIEYFNILFDEVLPPPLFFHFPQLFVLHNLTRSCPLSKIGKNEKMGGRTMSNTLIKMLNNSSLELKK